jgi:omega-amidase
MRIGTLQLDLVWESATENCKNIEDRLLGVSEQVDIWVLPEMFTTGFSMYPEKIAHTNETVLSWMQKISTRINSCLVGSVMVKENEQYYNRLYWVFPDGSFQKYDKRHLFRMAGEDEAYAAGSEQLVIDYKGVRFMPLICYDLRFPVWSRNIKFQHSKVEFKYDCAVYVANWPAVRSLAWTTLLQARAIENLCYVVGVNRVGVDGNGVTYSGHSRVFDAKGLRLDAHNEDVIDYCVTELNIDELFTFRKNFPANLDADHFTLHSSVD